MKVGLIIKNDARSAETVKLFCNDVKADFFNLEKSEKIPDIIACFGGDGSFLRAVPFAIKYDAPIVSVNTGTLGFLSSFGSDEKNSFIRVITDNLFDTEEIPLFSAKITDGQTKEKQEFLFVNEATIQRVTDSLSYNGAISLCVYADGKPCQKFVSDGVIVASPIGSTAYSLSAGGAILSPELDGMIITPLCPHTVSARPIVVSAKSVISVTTGDKTHDCALLTDGVYRKTVKKDNTITVKKTDKKLKIIAGSKDFYEKLNEKLLKWGEGYV